MGLRTKGTKAFSPKPGPVLSRGSDHVGCINRTEIQKVGQTNNRRGCSSHLRWEWSVGEFMTEAAEIVFRSFLGGQWSGTRPAPTGAWGDCSVRVQAPDLPLRVWRGVGTQVGGSTVPIVHEGGACEGGRCGGNPPAQGRAEGPTAQLQWSEISGEWSVGTALGLIGDANWLWLSRYQRWTEDHPHVGLGAPEAGRDRKGGDGVLNGAFRVFGAGVGYVC